MFVNPYDPAKWFKPTPDQRYHIVYLTTNLVNNKIYVGVHSTMKIEDGYLGSGKTLIKAIKKYSKENFKRIVLYYCLSITELYDIEANIVDELFTLNINTYNIKTGGDLTPRLYGKHNGFYGKHHTSDTKDIISNHNKNNSYCVGREMSEETRNKIK